MVVRTEKIIATVLDEAHKRQVEEIMDTPQEGLEGLYRRPLLISKHKSTPGTPGADRSTGVPGVKPH